MNLNVHLPGILKHLRQVTCQQGNFDEAEDPDDYEGESDADSDASDDAAAGRGNFPLSQLCKRAPFSI